MKKFALSLLALCLSAVAAFAAEDEYVEPETPPVVQIEPAPMPVQEESQWERFKFGAKEAGGAIAEGTRRTAGKAGDAVVRGSKKAGRAIADGYEDVKDYVTEKVD